jgi:hypothetical protein
MKKFTNLITEANIYQKGTPFSNGHRTRNGNEGFLNDQHLMIDIDRIVFNPDGTIWAIIEEKKQTPKPGSELKNILNTVTSQKRGLLEAAKILKCHLFVNLVFDQMYYQLFDINNMKEFTKEVFDKASSERNYTSVNTDNKIFLEFRNNFGKIKFTAVVRRGTKDGANTKDISAEISQKLNVPLIEVDDYGQKIVFYKDGQFMGEVDSILYPNTVSSQTRARLENEWETLYKKMNIF